MHSLANYRAQYWSTVVWTAGACGGGVAEEIRSRSSTTDTYSLPQSRRTTEYLHLAPELASDVVEIGHERVIVPTEGRPVGRDVVIKDGRGWAPGR
jgi:hypothetical protein